MAAPDTKFIWDDQSDIPVNNITNTGNNVDRPVFMTVFSSDKGPEKFQKNLSGEDFFKLYGDAPNFEAHGQPLLQAARIATAGGLQYCKRVVAPDSKLANLSLVAEVSKIKIQTTNSDGKPLYTKSVVSTNYWVETTVETEKQASIPAYDESKDYKLGDIVYKAAKEGSTKTFYKAVADAAASDAKAKIGYLTTEVTTDPTYSDPTSGAVKESTPVQHNAASIKYSLMTLPDELQVNNTEDIDKVFRDLVNNSLKNKDKLTSGEVAATTYWKEYTRNGSETTNMLLKLAKAEQWKATRTYYSGDIVKVGAAYYISNVSSNIGHNPTIDSENTISQGSGSTSTSNGKKFLLFTITDTGRGVSSKYIRITADQYTRRPVNYVKYALEVLDGNKTIETLYFTLNDDIVESTDGTAETRRSMALETIVKRQSKNLRAKFYKDEFDSFVEEVSNDTIDGTDSTTEYEVMNGDILFGYDRYGRPSANISIDANSSNLAAVTGNNLVNGSNGSFGNYPIKLTPAINDDGTTTGLSAYEQEVYNVFSGKYSDDIYDLDDTRIDVIFDCAYPIKIKKAIAELVEFREDCFFFRDFGASGNTDFASISDTLDTINDKSRFCANYINNFDTVDPYSKKEISVSVTYPLAGMFANHYINGVSRPFCGQKYGIIFSDDEIVPGTINFSPKRTPRTDANILTYDQKQWFDDYRLNYIAYYNGVPTMDTEYTSQERYTQLSWLHNVLMVQKVMHTVRIQCPKDRYSFINGNDYAQYKDDVQTVLNKFSSMFKTIDMKYVEDENYALNKVFYAVIEVSFKDFVQSEIFKLTEFNSTSATLTSSTTTA